MECATLNDCIATEPMWLQSWIMWMVIVNMGAILFAIWKVEARWIVGAMIANALFMGWLFDQVGYVRLLGLSHVIFWTPLLIYLARRLKQHDAKSLFGAYLWVVVLTDGASLIIDYIDVARYVMGDGQLG